jgi:hypothetical protein
MPPYPWHFGNQSKDAYYVLSEFSGRAFPAGPNWPQGDNPDTWYFTVDANTGLVICDESNPASGANGFQKWVDCPHLARSGPGILPGAGYNYRSGGNAIQSLGGVIATWDGRYAALYGGTVPTMTGELLIYDGATNTTNDINFINDPRTGFVGPALIVPYGIDGLPWSISPDGRYAYGAASYTAPGVTSFPQFGYPTTVGAFIIEVDLYAQAISNIWQLRPPYMNLPISNYNAQSGYTNTVQASNDTVFVGFVGGTYSGNNFTTFGYYRVWRSSGYIETGVLPSGSRFGYALSADNEWILNAGSNGSDLSGIGTMYASTFNITNPNRSYSIPGYSNGYLEMNSAWWAPDGSKFYVSIMYGSVRWGVAGQQAILAYDPYCNLIWGSPTNWGPYPSGQQIILSNFTSLGTWVLPNPGPINQENDGTTILATVDSNLNFIASWAPPSGVDYGVSSEIWVSPDESYCLLATGAESGGTYPPTGTYPVPQSAQRKEWNPTVSAYTRASVIKLGLPNLNFISQSEYAYGDYGGNGWYGSPFDIFELQNVPVVFRTPPQRQYPRSDGMALGGARQKVGRGNPPKTHQYSPRQLFKGTHY